MLPTSAPAVAAQTSAAELLHDKFHVAKPLGEALDKVHRAERKALLDVDDSQLKGTGQLSRFRKTNLSPWQRRRFTAARQRVFRRRGPRL